MQISVNYDSSVTSKNFSGGALEEAAFKAAINYVVKYYDAIFTNPVTVTIDVGYGEYGPNNTPVNGPQTPTALGVTSQNKTVYDYSTVQSKLAALPTTSPFGGFLLLTIAQQRALGLISPTGGTKANPDAYVGFSSTPNIFSYAPNASPPAPDQTYFVGVVEHEFSEVMGRLSFTNTNGLSYSVMDLYRYSSADGTRQLGAGSPAYFSIDNGATPLDYWNNVTLDPTGDFGDWAATGPGGATDHPTGPDAYLDRSPAEQINGVTATDLTLMSVLGWNVAASWALPVSGNFDVGTNWNSLAVPGPDVNALISVAGTYTVTTSANETVASLITAKGATLAISSGKFTITNGTGTGAIAGTIVVADGATLQLGRTVKNAGTIGLNSTGDATILMIAGTVALQGSGAVTLSDNADNTIQSNGSPATLTNVGNTISGAGQIGLGDRNLTLVNNKTIDATGTNNALVIDTGNAVSNSGKLEATGASGLTIEDTIDNTPTGAIDAAASGSVVDLVGGNIDGGKVDIVAGATLEATGGASTLSAVTVTDKGTLKATRGTILTLTNTTVNAAGGVVEAADALLIPAEIKLNNATINNGTLTNNGGIIDTIAGTNNTLNGVTISTGTTVTIADNSTLTLHGAISNNGSTDLDSGSDPTTLAISGGVSLSGGGNVFLTDAATNAIASNGSKATLTNVDNAISGAGSIGKGDATLTLINKGNIDANGTNPLIINTGSNTITNAGTLEATNGGTLIIDSRVAESGTGIATINGGTLEFGAASNVNTTFAPVAGTRELTGIVGADSTGISTNEFDMTAFNGKALFNGLDASGNNGLWITDGTAQGTHELTGIVGAALSLNPQAIAVLNGKALFDGRDANGAYSLWVTDGTAQGTHELTGIVGTDPNGIFNVSDPAMIAFNGEVVFSGSDANGNPGLWVTDGTAQGTHEVLPGTAPIAQGDVGIYPTVFNGKVLFSSTGRELWVTDGTGAGTQAITNVTNDPPNQVSPRYFTPLGNQVLFSSENQGPLWATDGTIGGTYETDTGLTNIIGSAALNGEVLLNATTANFLWNLWVTDGTAQGTQELNFAGKVKQDTALSMLPFNGKILFNAVDANGDSSLWATDGTTQGTHELTVLPSGDGFYDATIVNGKVLFNSGDGNLWVTDGTVSGSASGANVLKLDDAPQFTGTVSGLGAGDSVDMTDINLATLKPLKYTANAGNTGGTLTVSDGVDTAKIALLGQYMAAGFHDAGDSGTGTVITYTPSGAQSNEALLATPQHS
jgi:ELWxxDGT repeat protein